MRAVFHGEGAIRATEGLATQFLAGFRIQLGVLDLFVLELAAGARGIHLGAKLVVNLLLVGEECLVFVGQCESRPVANPVHALGCFGNRCRNGSRIVHAIGYCGNRREIGTHAGIVNRNRISLARFPLPAVLADLGGEGGLQTAPGGLLFV